MFAQVSHYKVQSSRVRGAKCGELKNFTENFLNTPYFLKKKEVMLLVKQNLGKLDRIFRFVLALWFLSLFKPRLGVPWADWLILFVGLIALVESFTGWCGLHDWLGINNKNQ